MPGSRYSSTCRPRARTQKPPLALSTMPSKPIRTSKASSFSVATTSFHRPGLMFYRLNSDEKWALPATPTTGSSGVTTRSGIATATSCPKYLSHGSPMAIRPIWFLLRYRRVHKLASTNVRESGTQCARLLRACMRCCRAHRRCSSRPLTRLVPPDGPVSMGATCISCCTETGRTGVGSGARTR